jgi:alpha-L-fucosidase 2
MFILLRRVLLALSACSMLCMVSITAAQEQGSETLWYAKPAAIWDEALPIGNGRLGAMVFGGANTTANNGDQQNKRVNVDIADGSKTRPQDEHLQLNESTLWQGSRADKLNPLGHEGFLEARKLLLDSHGMEGAKIAEAEKVLEDKMLSTPRGMPGYSTLGDLYIRTRGEGQVKNYKRQLDLQTGMLRVSYTLNGTHYAREMFASAPDGVVVVHLTADRPGVLSFALGLDRHDDFSVKVLDSHNLALTQGTNHADQIRFQGQVRVLATGGRVEATEKALDVSEADEVTLLIAAATDFKGGNFRGDPPTQQCAATLDRVAAKPYGELRKAAALDTDNWMNRFSFKLGHHDAALDKLPTDERLARVSAGGDDLGLQQLYFEYARYLLIGSSRPGGLPANLQGIWAGSISNPWGSKWTININTEMNYWLAEPSNLGDLTLPLVDLDEMVRTPGSGTGKEVAEKYYAARGFVAHHNTDIWGDAHPIDLVGSGIWPMGGAWLTLHAWDHYAYSLDAEYLRKRAYPLLHDASLFFLDYLVDDGHGHLVTGPSISPENRYKLSDGSFHSVTMGPTMDIEIVRELFERTVQASEILQIDPAFEAQVKAAQEKLPPFQIGHRGNLQEWPLDYDDAEPGHRHISHLWALYPGSQITLDHTPELARAAQTTLEARLGNGGGQTGWSRAWVINYWDRLHNGEQAYNSMEVMFKQSTFPNMMDTHPPGLFQIDGNLGAAAGMLEALVQSRWYSDHAEVDLMPALPPKWHDGELTGVRIRGGGELHLQWAGSKVALLEWRCTHTGKFDLRVPAGQTLRSLQDGGKSVPYTQADSVVHMNLQQDHSYKLVF